MDICVILNPAAGRGQAGRQRPAIEAALRSQGVEYELLTTHARGGATELTFQAAERGRTTVVAIGGDGTLNEVLNGLVDLGPQAPALAMIPLGTGSDFARMFRELRPDDFAGGARRIASGQNRPIDAARITVYAGRQTLRRAFINGLGMGLDAAVAVESLKIRRLRGSLVYYWAIIKALATYRPGPMHVRYDGGELNRPLFFASVGNGRFQGGGFCMTPAAELDDGRLDLCVVDTLGMGKVMRYLPLLRAGRHTRLPEVTMARSKRVEVSCPTGIPIATDGEVVATDATRAEVEVLPGAVRLVI
ncbi:MAG: diacylglycerol kinase family lipid kinase [Oscillochloris sp.]|nr:diacylglycerol kinase family lipid kinase [Oscillochloris sp.]